MFDSFEIKADARTYRVDIQPGCATSYLRDLPADTIVICDEIFASRLSHLACPVMSLPALETRKTLAEGGRLAEAARAAGLTRKGQIIAVGGGIIQDVACLVASIYMRGIRWSYVPTTILGMVDSCIGGKSSINVGAFKNLVGTIHPPDRIVIDPDFAETLAMEHRAGGLCEALKIAFARGDGVFARYAALDPSPVTSGTDLAEIVALSLRAKQWFIEIDEFDQNERLTLNFGHTFGHALETASNFAITHGAAVGLGMLCALDFATSRGTIDRNDQLRQLETQTLGLLRAIPSLVPSFMGIDMAHFERAVLSDKKHTADRLTLILPVSVTDGGLPLRLCRFPREAEIFQSISRSVERTQRMLAA